MEIPVKIPAEIIPIPDFQGGEETEPVFKEPVLDPYPPFVPPEPVPKPPLVLRKKGKAPPPPQIRPYPWQPTPMPPLDLQPPLLLPEPEFVPPPLELAMASYLLKLFSELIHALLQ